MKKTLWIALIPALLLAGFAAASTRTAAPEPTPVVSPAAPGATTFRDCPTCFD